MTATRIHRALAGGLAFQCAPLSDEQARTFNHACEVFAHLIRRGESLSFSDWADRIEGMYSRNAKRDACCDAIRAAGGLQRYWLSVIRTIQSDAAAYRVDVLRVECTQPLQWVRQHADEIATKHGGPGYVALMVRDHQPEDERAACAPAVGIPLSRT